MGMEIYQFYFYPLGYFRQYKIHGLNSEINKMGESLPWNLIILQISFSECDL